MLMTTFEVTATCFVQLGHVGSLLSFGFLTKLLIKVDYFASKIHVLVAWDYIYKDKKYIN